MIEKVYIRSWYNKFSANESVPRKLRHIICFMTRKLSGRLEKMNIQEFIFEDIGQIFKDLSRLIMLPFQQVSLLAIVSYGRLHWHDKQQFKLDLTST